jgi:hypothetical protein
MTRNKIIKKKVYKIFKVNKKKIYKKMKVNKSQFNLNKIKNNRLK